MPLHHLKPAYLRYLKAQLLNLKRPSFWGTAIFLCAVGLVIRQYWENPTNILAYNKQQNQPVITQQTAESELTAEEKAIFADIDNLPLLLNDFEQVTTSLTSINYPKNNQQQKSENFLEEAIKKQNAANEAKSKANLFNDTSAVNSQNPFVLQAETLLQPDTSAGNAQFLGYRTFNTASNQAATINSSPLGIGLINSSRQNQNNNLFNPLETTANQSNNQNFPNLTNPNTNYINPNQINNPNYPILTNINTNNDTTSINPISNTFNNRNPITSNQNLPSNNGIGYIDPSLSKQPNNSYPGINNNSPLPTQTAPVTGVAPVTNFNNNINNNYSAPNQNQTVTNPSTTGYSNYGNSTLPQSNYGSYTGQQPGQLPSSSYGNYGSYAGQQPSQTTPNYPYPGQPQQYQNNYPR